MNYRYITYSFLIAFTAACSTDSAIDKSEQSAEVKAREAEVIRSLTDGRKDRDRNRPFIDESRPVIAGKSDDKSIPDAGQRNESDRVVIQDPVSSPGPHETFEEIRQPLPPIAVADATVVAKHHSQVRNQSFLSSNIIPGRTGTEPLYREQYEHPADNRVTRVGDNPVSTFSIDVDTGAYTNVRRWLTQGSLPPEDAVRVEEFINYFDYDYPAPNSQKQPFLVETEIAPTPWNSHTHLFRVGIQGYEVPSNRMPPKNLVFLIDVSGSMQSADKLPLLKDAFRTLAGNLNANDRVAMVVYAGASGVVLPPTPGNHQSRILNALDQLHAGGSTNGAAGIRLAYQLARSSFREDGINRVILATDGDFNVGLASTNELIDLIRQKRDAGIALTTLGFGSGNYNDHLLEQLANEGNGNHAYIDRRSEAHKVLSQELSATLMTIASDVKIQVEFNPATVSEYRLIGYENRALNEEDFNNDRIDAGEIGAGHRVTALYEISLSDSGYQRLANRRYADGADSQSNASVFLSRAKNAELAHLRIRYKRPGESRSRLIESPVMRSSVAQELTRSSNDFRFAAAVAAFGQKLRGGSYLETFNFNDIWQLADQARGHDAHGYRQEFLQLVSQAAQLSGSDPVAMYRLED